VTDIVIHALTAAAYAGLAWHFWNTRWRAQPAADASSGLRPWERAAILVPLVLHGVLLYNGVIAPSELRFGFAPALSAMLWLTVAICWAESLFHRIEALYPIALAAAAVFAPLPAFFVGRSSPDAISFEFLLHVLFGILAYSLFTVATLHALLLSILDRRLHISHSNAQHAAGSALVDGPLFGLPPLLSLEKLVFRLTGAAFAVLTLTFAVGIAYSEAFLGRAMRFDHKTVFVILSWLTFGLLLAGHWLYGWRGRAAWRWTLAGFALLLLAYPGSRFVLEVVLGRN